MGCGGLVRKERYRYVVDDEDDDDVLLCYGGKIHTTKINTFLQKIETNIVPFAYTSI